VSSPRLQWAVASCVAAWAVARIAAADRYRPLEQVAVPLLSLTPQVAAAAGLAALMLDAGPAATAALAGGALAAVTVPRAIPRRQPAADGPVLRVLTVNLLFGRAAGRALVDLVRATDADVLFLQELSDEAVPRITPAGPRDLLPSEMGDTQRYRYRGSGIYARYPLSDGLAIGQSFASQPTARVDLPSGQSAQLVCVHPHPPYPPWSPRAVPRWRGELGVLPPPGGRDDPPVILAGDYNATHDHAQFRRLLRLGYVDAASQVGKGLVPTWGPTVRSGPAFLTFDHVLADPRCAVLATAAYPLPGSDHRALYAELRLPS
jgi:endonuclease/exonuclease/phosphatase (EEP) superfamily protein YafD